MFGPVILRSYADLPQSGIDSRSHKALECWTALPLPNPRHYVVCITLAMCIDEA